MSEPDDDLMGELPTGTDETRNTTSADNETAPQNHFPNVFAFVETFLITVYARPVSNRRTDFRWCSKWFWHPEAVSRLEGLWKAFEVLRLDPGTGASVWWRDHADPCMNALTDAQGPFAACSDTTHQRAPQLPMDEVPKWLLLGPNACPSQSSATT